MTSRRWLGFGLALALAIGVALGIGSWMRQRNNFAMDQWLQPGGAVTLNGSEFSLESFGRVEPPPASDAVRLPDGAVVVRLDLKQQVSAIPDDPYELACTITLHTRQASWPLDWDLPNALGANTDCVPTEIGESRTVSAVWAVPPQVLDQNPWVEIRFHSTKDAFGVRP